MEKLIIPNKVKAGFNKRSDTYSGRLAYVIYHDGKTWRKEKSWESWRQHPDKEVSRWDYEQNARVNELPGEIVKPLEFDNIPTSGFVLNKKVGGHSNGWNHRSTYCRVFDPRGFEFEITVPNLLYILQETNSYKGKGLEGEFVYSWDGKDLVLLPCSSPDYAECKKFTALQNEKISAKDLVPGAVYQTKQMKTVIYLGRMDWWEFSHKSEEISRRFDSGRQDYFNRHRELINYRNSLDQKNNRGHIFYSVEEKKFIRKDASFLAAKTEEASPQFAELLQSFYESPWAAKIVSWEMVPADIAEFESYCYGCSYVEAYVQINGEFYSTERPNASSYYSNIKDGIFTGIKAKNPINLDDLTFENERYYDQVTISIPASFYKIVFTNEHNQKINNVWL